MFCMRSRCAGQSRPVLLHDNNPWEAYASQGPLLRWATMKISVQRYGGYAGGSENVGVVDTATLGEAARQVEGDVQKLRFFDLPSNLPSNEIGADFVKYDVTIADGERSHTVTFTDDDSPTARQMRELVNRVTQG